MERSEELGKDIGYQRSDIRRRGGSEVRGRKDAENEEGFLTSRTPFGMTAISVEVTATKPESHPSTRRFGWVKAAARLPHSNINEGGAPTPRRRRKAAATCGPLPMSGQAKDRGHIHSREDEGVVEAEEFARFGGGDSGVGRETIKMVEAGARGPGGEGGFALTGEVLLEAVEILAGLGIARRDGAAGAGVAAFKVDFADSEADNAAFVLAEELVFPEGGQLFAESGPLRADI